MPRQNYDTGRARAYWQGRTDKLRMVIRNPFWPDGTLTEREDWEQGWNDEHSELLDTISQMCAGRLT